MTDPKRDWLFWSPRVLTMLFSVFASMFALDVFEGAAPLSEKLLALAIHLIPVAVLLLILVVAWRWEWVGGVFYLAIAAWYTLFFARGHLDWSLVIAGPLALAGVLFLLGWRRRRAPQAGA
jgi:hypothetical protein